MEEGHTSFMYENQRKSVPRGRPKIRWDDNIIWDLKEVDYEVAWKTLAQDRETWGAYVLAVMNLRVP